MTTTIATASGKTAITIKYAADTAVMSLVLDSIAQGLYEQRGQWGTNLGEIPPYEELTMAQKLALIDTYVRWHLIEIHRQRLLRVAQKDYETATAAAYVTGTITLE